MKSQLRYAFAFTLGIFVGFLLEKSISGPKSSIDRPSRVAGLIKEFTISPDRQQAALDEIARDGDGAYMYILSYLDDERRLASNSVKFLSTHPKRTEKYSMMEAGSVGEAMLRYLCFLREFDVHHSRLQASASAASWSASRPHGWSALVTQRSISYRLSCKGYPATLRTSADRTKPTEENTLMKSERAFGSPLAGHDAPICRSLPLRWV